MTYDDIFMGFIHRARNEGVAASLLQAPCPISGCVHIACFGLKITSRLEVFEVDCRNFISASLMQVVLDKLEILRRKGEGHHKGRVTTTAHASNCGPALPNPPYQLCLWEKI